MAKKLLNGNHVISIVERDKKVCEKIAKNPKILIVNGDACDPEFLEEAGIKKADVVAAVTGAQEFPNRAIRLVIPFPPGQGVDVAIAQMVAEELDVDFKRVSVVMGDTDRTPDGGFSAGYLWGGMPNVRKAAAYTYQALLDLAASKLGVPRDQLSVENGVVTGGGRRVTYGELVAGQALSLSIPVTGKLTRELTVTGGFTIMQAVVEDVDQVGVSGKVPMGVPLHVSVTPKRGEGLGFVGRVEGIACWAVAMLCKG